MTDRELMEAAAKAVGIVGEYRTEHMCINGDWLDVTAIHTDAEWWNPLTDDGDALRLAVKLRLTPLFGGRGVNVMHEGTLVSHDGAEAYGSDPYSATRRAIVRAAATMVTR